MQIATLTMLVAVRGRARFRFLSTFSFDESGSCNSEMYPFDTWTPPGRHADEPRRFFSLNPKS